LRTARIFALADKLIYPRIHRARGAFLRASPHSFVPLFIFQACRPAKSLICLGIFSARKKCLRENAKPG
jgi:hypothetical protein